MYANSASSHVSLRWSMIIAFNILVFYPVRVIPQGASCPRKCQCIWRESKITVDCSDKSLAGIPATVETNTQALNMSGNSIPILSARQFSSLGLINLQRVSMSRCGLSQVDGHAFGGLTNMVELDLSSNQLQEIPSDTLNIDVPELMTLTLAGNPIGQVRAMAFHRLAHLSRLDLSKCQISIIESGAFDGLMAIQRIYLHGNHLVRISAGDLPPSLHGISVYDNRWRCDCHLRSFRMWLIKSNVPLEHGVEPVCQNPRRLLGIRVRSLSLAEFACEPELSPTSMYLTVPRGKNVSIVCTVSSDPLSDVTWFFDGKRIDPPPEIVEEPLTSNNIGHASFGREYNQQNNLASSSSISSHRYYDGTIHRSNEYGENNKGHHVQGNARYSGPGHKSPLSVGTQGQVRHRASTTTSNTHEGRIRVLMRREDPIPSGLSGRDGNNEFDSPGFGGNIRSELFIQGTGPADNGTYRCQAENKAARATSNFTLHVTDRTQGGTLGGGTIMQLRFEYFIIVAVSVILILIMVLIAATILLIRLCRKRILLSSSTSTTLVDGSSGSVSQKSSLSNDKKVSASTGTGNQKGDPSNQQTNGNFLSVPNYGGSSNNLIKQNGITNGKVHPTVPAKMPKHIQMGTGFPLSNPPVLSTNLIASSSQPSQTNLTQGNEGTVIVTQPDLLTDHAKLNMLNNSFSTNMSSLKSSPGIKHSVSFDTQQNPSSPVGQMVVVSTGLSSSGGGSSQTSQGSYRRAMENIITDYSNGNTMSSSPMIGRTFSGKPGPPLVPKTVLHINREQLSNNQSSWHPDATNGGAELPILNALAPGQQNIYHQQPFQVNMQQKMNGNGGWQFQNPPPQYQNYNQSQPGMTHIMANGSLRPNQTYGGSTLSMLQPAPSTSTIFPLSSQTSPSYQQIYESANNIPYSSLQSSNTYFYGTPSPQTQPILRMAMLPDEKYPDVSLHPSNAAVLYGTLQKVPPQRTASVAALPLSFEMGNVRAPGPGQQINQQNMPSYAYRVFNTNGPHNNAVNSPVSLQPSTSTFANPGNAAAISFDCNNRQNESSEEKDKVIHRPPMLSNREIEAMYARPTSKQNQIGIPITIPQTTNKINRDTLQKLSRNSQNYSQDVPNLDQTKETHKMTTVPQLINNEVSGGLSSSRNDNESNAKLYTELNDTKGKIAEKPDEILLNQENITNAAKRNQEESHLLQLRKGSTSNKPIFTSIFRSSSPNHSNSLNKNTREDCERKSVGGIASTPSKQRSNEQDSADSSTVIYSRVNKRGSSKKATNTGSPDTTTTSENTTNQVLRKSDESHLVEDRALERLGKLLSASASIFSTRDHQNIPQGDNTVDEREACSQNHNEDLMSISDTSSHLWQGISDFNHTNAPNLDKTDGNAPIAMGEDSLNSSTSGGEEQTDNENGEETSSSTPQFDQSIRSGTPQQKLTLDSQNLRIYKELDDAFSSLDEEIKQQSKSTI